MSDECGDFPYRGLAFVQTHRNGNLSRMAICINSSLQWAGLLYLVRRDAKCCKRFLNSPIQYNFFI